jgi:hypothetical protein
MRKVKKLVRLPSGAALAALELPVPEHITALNWTLR